MPDARYPSADLRALLGMLPAASRPGELLGHQPRRALAGALRELVPAMQQLELADQLFGGASPVPLLPVPPPSLQLRWIALLMDSQPAPGSPPQGVEHLRPWLEETIGMVEAMEARVGAPRVAA